MEAEDFAPGGGLPALPANLVETIQKGSFVEFGDLLPESIFEAFVNAGDKDKDKKRRKPHQLRASTAGRWLMQHGLALL